MTGEVKADGRRKRFHQRSKSSIGDYTSPMHLDPIKDTVQTKEAGKPTAKEVHSRSWFKSKKFSTQNPEATSDLEVTEDLKPLRVVQGVYRDDDGGPSPKILVTSHSAARDAVKEFAKDLVAQMKAGDPDESLAMESQMRRQVGSPPPTTDLKFVAQAYVAHHLFSDFENASFGIPNPGEKPWEVQDHMRRCFALFQKCKTKSQTISTLLENDSKLSFLSQFCVKKFQSIGAFEPVEKGRHPDTPFYRSFLSAAVSVWLLQRLAFSFEQKIVPIVPTRGDAFQRRFMAPVVPGIGDSESEENDGDLEISFTVFPGFRVSESIVESLVHIVERPKMDMTTSSPVVEESSSVAPGPPKSLKGGEHSLLQKIRSKFTRKKTLVKGTTVAENNETKAPPPPPVEPAAQPLEEPAPSRESEESTAPSEEEPSPPTDDEQNNTAAAASVASPVASSVQPSELSSPPLNLEVTDSYVPPSSNPYFPVGVDDDNRLYIPRAEMSKLLQSPLRSPRLSSVD